jgi:hypothetical protein
MFKVGPLMKWGIGALLSIVVVASGGLALQKSPIGDKWSGDPSNTITLLGAEKHRDCAVVVRYEYTATSPDYRVLIMRERVDGADAAFLGFARTDQTGVVEYLDTSVPQGTWKYQVFFSTPETVASKWSDPVVIDSTECSPDFVRMPINPIASASTTGKCDIDVSVNFLKKDINPQYTPGDGIRFYRSSQTEPMSLIAYITMTDLLNQGESVASEEYVGHFLDKNLPAGTYTYMAEIYSKDGATQSNTTDPVTIDDISCKSFVDIEIPVSVSIQPVETNVPDAIPAVPQACVWQAAVNVFLRKGPNVALFEVAGAVEKGQSYPVLGQSEDGLFWVVEFRPGKQAYVTKSDTYSLMSGDCSQIPTVQDPEQPLPPPTEQVTNDDTPVDEQGVAPECSDGIDNDGDGQVDGSDRNCIASSGAHE